MNQPSSAMLDLSELDHEPLRGHIVHIQDSIGAQPGGYDRCSSGAAGSHIQGTKHWEYAWLWNQVEPFMIPNGSYMDAGAGGGALQVWLAKQGYNVDAVDPEPLARNFSHSFKLGQRHRYHPFNMNVWMEMDHQYDGIFCVSVLEHLPVDERKKAMAGFARCLKPGGFLALSIDYLGIAIPFHNVVDMIAPAIASGVRFDLMEMERASRNPEPFVKRAQAFKDLNGAYTTAAFVGWKQ